MSEQAAQNPLAIGPKYHFDIRYSPADEAATAEEFGGGGVGGAGTRWMIADNLREQAALLDIGRPDQPGELDAETLARWFHEVYESLAPHHGYRTRDASRTWWSQVPEENRRLMVATATEVLRRARSSRLDGADDLRGGA